MILERLFVHVAPHNCIGCEAEGRLLCQACAGLIVRPPARCYRCHRLSPGGKTCQTCRHHSDLYAVHAGAIYDGLAKDLVWRLKLGGAQGAAREMASLLAENSETADNLIVMHVPTATSRVRQRGYDQAQLLARAFSERAGLRYLPCLARLGQHKQVGASRKQRTAQLASAFRVLRPALVQNAHILLVDDVLTTGATLEAASKALKVAGAKRVSAIVFAQA